MSNWKCSYQSSSNSSSSTECSSDLILQSLSTTSSWDFEEAGCESLSSIFLRPNSRLLRVLELSMDCTLMSPSVFGLIRSLWAISSDFFQRRLKFHLHRPNGEEMASTSLVWPLSKLSVCEVDGGRLCSCDCRPCMVFARIAKAVSDADSNNSTDSKFSEFGFHSSGCPASVDILPPVVTSPYLEPFDTSLCEKSSSAGLRPASATGFRCFAFATVSAIRSSSAFTSGTSPSASSFNSSIVSALS
mmetsp:Transcript_20081/g.46588  ORF Transcript_20081/g.46588 Transcript_20081/m.46588 type:complete len:245 (+) Transcript_20081:369-1103(+)